MNSPKHPVRIAVIGLALSALACNLGAPASPTQAPGAATANAAPTQAEAANLTAPAAPSGDSLDIVGRALRAELNAKAYRIHTTGSDGDTQYASTIEYVAPDHVHAIVGKSEYIYVKGVGTWKKGSDGRWVKSATDVSALVFAAYDPAGIEAIMKNVVVGQVKLLGPELKDGRATLVYQFVSRTTLSAGTKLLVTSNMWIGVTDGLPYRLETDNDSILKAGAKAHSESVIDYDPTITFETPSS